MVRLWDPISGQQTGVLHGMTETVTEVAFTCDAKHVLASGADQAVRMWDVSSGRVRHTLTGHSQKARLPCPPLPDLLCRRCHHRDETRPCWGIKRG